VTGLAFSAIPAFHISRGGLNDALKEGGRVAAASGRHRARASIVVSELAVALVLLIAAGLLIKSFIRIQQASPGFNPQNVVTMDVSLPKAKYQTDAQAATFFRQALDRISTAPGVEHVALATSLPLTSSWQNSFAIEGKPMQPNPHAHGAIIGGSYFPTMQIPVVRGREFTAIDKADSKPVIIVDANIVRAYFGNEDPIGKRIALTSEGSEQKPLWREIVGVVGSVKHTNPLDIETKGQFYLPFEQSMQKHMMIAARTSTDPLSVAPAIRREILAIDPEQPISRVRSMEDILNDFVAQPRFNMILLGGFAALALILAAVGVYGVMAYSVTQRTHEIGVRMALGAQRADVLRMVLYNAMAIAGIGLAIGVVASLLASRVLGALLFGVSPNDPLTFLGISLLLAIIAAVASYLPAYRATRIDPLIALRYE
jgi:putative ABC transport system permease protein